MSTVKIKTSELTGAALDWAVAKCEAERLTVPYGGKSFLDGVVVHPDYNKFYPSTDWAQGGPIIEREAVHLFQQESTSEWTASLPRDTKVGWRILRYGPTPLIAAMRCYVASKLGDEVEIPEELTGA